jgi:PKD repeat protein
MKVCLTADPTNCATQTQSITILPPVTAPTINYTIEGRLTDTTAGVDDPITFTDNSSGNPTTVEWMIGSQKFTTKSVSFKATSAGDVAWSLTVSNSAGSASAKGQLRFVDRKAPTAQFASAAKVAVGASTQFTDQSTGYVTAWAWDFGGQGTSDKQSPEFVFPKVGTYTVKLTTSNDWGSTVATKDVVVTVTPQISLPSAISIDGSGATKRIEIRRGTALTLQAGPVTAGVESWTWDFGDGTSGTGATATKTYDAGEYQLVLTARFSGSQATERDVVIVEVT